MFGMPRFEPQPDTPDGRASPVYLTVRGRGAAFNPGNRYETTRREVDLGALEEINELPGAPVPTTILPDRTRTILNEVDPATSPDIGFRWTLNPYRGCTHGCSYCYARPDHERLGMSSGLDFETKIVAKHDAPRLLRRELASPRWQPDTVVMAGVTDVYQPIERDLRLTRGCLEVFAECRHPVAIVTKNRLVTRDLDLLAELARHNAARVAVSVTTLNNKLAASLEPRASSPGERLAAIGELTAAGVPVTVMVAPIIPGLTDHETPAILRAAAEHGATGAAYVLLRLPHQVKEIFLDWLRRCVPGRAAHVESLIRQTRGGNLYDPRFGRRQRGEGAVARQIGATFKLFARRHGLTCRRSELNTAAFRRPAAAGQGSLFE